MDRERPRENLPAPQLHATKENLVTPLRKILEQTKNNYLQQSNVNFLVKQTCPLEAETSISGYKRSI